MEKQKHTKEGIIKILQNLAKQLQTKKLSNANVQQVLSTSAIRYRFGSVGDALEAAGLQRTRPGENLVNRGNVLSDSDLFQSLLDVENKIGREPTISQYNAHGKYSDRPLRKRFGKWKDILLFYQKWKVDNSIAISSNENNTPEQRIPMALQSDSNVNKLPLPVTYKNIGQLYGEPIDFRGLRHAPINEQGVVYLFGMISRELGFYIEALQQGFPDCEGKCLCDEKRNLWGRARIEFEYKALNFKEHGHDPKQCDFIVCWINDWQDCPIKIIELKTEILKLPSK